MFFPIFLRIIKLVNLCEHASLYIFLFSFVLSQEIGNILGKKCTMIIILKKFYLEILSKIFF